MNRGKFSYPNQTSRSVQVLVSPSRPSTGQRNLSSVSQTIHGVSTNPNNLNEYTPWCRYKLHNSPFPRYRHVASSVVSSDNKVFVIGGLHDQSVYGDTWIISENTININSPATMHTPTSTTSTTSNISFSSKTVEITEYTPPPRVGHASTLCGNAFVIFGGDTHKTNKDGLMDDDIYLFNINSYKWTIPQPVGPRPLGRYGHKISIIATSQMKTKLYVFGGQFDDSYFNDLCVYDLSSFRKPESHWEFLKPKSFIPPPLTNHTMVSYDYKLWVFGGDTQQGLINQLFMFDPVINDWRVVETTGEKPPPVQEHAAVMFNDLMCIMGGKDEQDVYLNSVYFLNLKSLKWFKFNDYKLNIPQGRSGHSITLLKNNRLLIMGGDKFDYARLDESDLQTSDVDMGKGTILYTLDLSRLEIECPGIFSTDKDAITESTTSTITPINSTPTVNLSNKNLITPVSTPQLSNDSSNLIKSNDLQNNRYEKFTGPTPNINILTPYANSENQNTPLQNIIQTPSSSNDKSNVVSPTPQSSITATPSGATSTTSANTINVTPYATSTTSPSITSNPTPAIPINHMQQLPNITSQPSSTSHAPITFNATEPITTIPSLSNQEENLTDSTQIPSTSTLLGTSSLKPTTTEDSKVNGLSPTKVLVPSALNNEANGMNNIDSTDKSSNFEKESLKTARDLSNTSKSVHSASQASDIDDIINGEIGVATIANSPSKAAVKYEAPSILNKVVADSIAISNDSAATTLNEEMFPELKSDTELQIKKPIDNASANELNHINEGQTPAIDMNTVTIDKKVLENIRTELSDLKELTQKKSREASNHVKNLEEEINKLKIENKNLSNPNSSQSILIQSKYDVLEADNKVLNDRLAEYEDLFGSKFLDIKNLNDIVKAQNEKIIKLEDSNSTLKAENHTLKEKQNHEDTEFRSQINSYSASIDNLLKEWNNSRELTTSLDNNHPGSTSTSPTTSSKSSSKENGTTAPTFFRVNSSRHDAVIDKLQKRLEDALTLNKELTVSNDKLNNDVKALNEKYLTLNNSFMSKKNEFTEIEKNYKSSLNSMLNANKALELSQKELTKYREMNGRLQKDLEELQFDKTNNAKRNISEASSFSKNSINNDSNDDNSNTDYRETHYKMKISDLKAELFIIKQERDNLKEDVHQMKKQLYTLNESDEV
ncbi:hypothetical protein TBLA_0C06530 [Henningerozyma blattae CBS 6284]|uniref:Uncharacterized protein n=1 Tax=Henningerozyma blattae (strain ATCC 34711 / CBS 6284 / DSM 70876 / NBRC 10599 / NRRL Y-10934 / UCD 77-7) TaxID=1071380 RepID=I2H244_HENB6|nr:hypothetical protein TBLA_0C06530 [Tetrapisispora blattae CBS 6284]CCH60446.1 hypothetical protein TBLA_0C06530 [Tetrapisispora blattae CBS 6284]